MFCEEWVDVGFVEYVFCDEVVRFDHVDCSYVVYWMVDFWYFVIDGECMYGRVYFVKGFLSGVVIECVKHNGRFDIMFGRVFGALVLIDLGCYEVWIFDGIL